MSTPKPVAAANKLHPTGKEKRPKARVLPPHAYPNPHWKVCIDCANRGEARAFAKVANMTQEERIAAIRAAYFNATGHKFCPYCAAAILNALGYHE